jgi:pilus assembly protein CpaF
MFDAFDFGLLQPWIDDPHITDINYNGTQCWVDHLHKGRYPIEPFPAHEFMQSLVYKIANYVNLPFNATSPVLEAETKELRISMVHHSVARGGNSISLRKTPATHRLHDPTTGIETYAPKAMIDYLKQAIHARKNIMVSGLPGSGKTELVKFLMEGIDPAQRVITIEDTLELRYGDMYPFKDSVMLKVQEHFSYEQAIKTSLRQRPDWICVSEVRGQEIVYLLQSISTGTSLISTIHAESAMAIPYRMMLMMPGHQLTNISLKTLIHDAIDVGVHLELIHDRQGIRRKIREIVEYGVNDKQVGHQNIIYERKTKVDQALTAARTQKTTKRAKVSNILIEAQPVRKKLTADSQ